MKMGVSFLVFVFLLQSAYGAESNKSFREQVIADMEKRADLLHDEVTNKDNSAIGGILGNLLTRNEPRGTKVEIGKIPSELKIFPPAVLEATILRLQKVKGGLYSAGKAQGSSVDFDTKHGPALSLRSNPTDGELSHEIDHIDAWFELYESGLKYKFTQEQSIHLAGMYLQTPLGAAYMETRAMLIQLKERPNLDEEGLIFAANYSLMAGVIEALQRKRLFEKLSSSAEIKGPAKSSVNQSLDLVNSQLARFADDLIRQTLQYRLEVNTIYQNVNVQDVQQKVLLQTYNTNPTFLQLRSSHQLYRLPENNRVVFYKLSYSMPPKSIMDFTGDRGRDAALDFIWQRYKQKFSTTTACEDLRDSPKK